MHAHEISDAVDLDMACYRMMCGRASRVSRFVLWGIWLTFTAPWPWR